MSLYDVRHVNRGSPGIIEVSVSPCDVKRLNGGSPGISEVAVSPCEVTPVNGAHQVLARLLCPHAM